MIRIYPYIFSLLACIGIALPGYSQVDRNETLIRSALHGLEYEIKAGFSIGGTAPLPLPVEIRSIDGYNPTLAISIGGEVTKWIAVQNKLGIIVGLRLENKAMTTEATVKNYNMEILGQGGERISGVWTGGVKTKVHTAGLTIPLMAYIHLFHATVHSISQRKGCFWSSLPLQANPWFYRPFIVQSQKLSIDSGIKGPTLC